MPKKNNLKRSGSYLTPHLEDSIYKLASRRMAFKEVFTFSALASYVVPFLIGRNNSELHN